jgi:hypothetical protein
MHQPSVMSGLDTQLWLVFFSQLFLFRFRNMTQDGLSEVYAKSAWSTHWYELLAGFPNVQGTSVTENRFEAKYSCVIHLLNFLWRVGAPSKIN